MTEESEELVYPSSFQPHHSPSAIGLPAPGPRPAWTARGVIAALEPLTTDERRERLRHVLDHRLHAVTVVLDDPHKAHNRSAVIRSCDAFGVQRAHFLLPPKGDKTERLSFSKLISKGTHNWLDLVEHRHHDSVIETLHRSGHEIFVTHPEGRLSPSALADIPKVALVLGNERFGIRPELEEKARDTVAIPMRGFVESLNVSVTAAILLEAATRGRSGDLTSAERENIYARWLRKSVPRADEVLGSFSPC